MNIVICDSAVKPASVASVAVHITNAQKISAYLNSCGHFSVVIFSDEDPFKRIRTGVDVLIFSYGSKYFDYLPWDNWLKQNPKVKVGWITNDYDLQPNGFYLHRLSFLIKNFETSSSKRLSSLPSIMVNLNTLVVNDSEPSVETSHKKFLCTYYGTFRKDRQKYFSKYLRPPLLLSCSTKNRKKYKDLGCTSQIIEKMLWVKGRETLRQFWFSLYIEDIKTHSNFSHFANRFYECLNANTIPLFDKTCLGTIAKEKDHKIPNDLLIDSLEDISKKRSEAERLYESDFFVFNKRIAVEQRDSALYKIESFLSFL